MDQKIINFLHARHKPFPLLIRHAPPRIPPIYIQQAAEQFYSTIEKQEPNYVITRDGQIKNINIARKIYEIAKGYKELSETDVLVYENDASVIRALKAELSKAHENWTELNITFAETEGELIALRKRIKTIKRVILYGLFWGLPWAILAYDIYVGAFHA